MMLKEAVDSLQILNSRLLPKNIFNGNYFNRCYLRVSSSKFFSTAKDMINVFIHALKVGVILTQADQSI